MVGQLTLDQHIGVRIPGGQPTHSKALTFSLTHTPESTSVGDYVGTSIAPMVWVRIDAAARAFAAQLRREFKQEYERDPRALRTALLKAMRFEFPLRRGRPNDPRIDEAIRMLGEGKSIREILCLQTSGFEKLDTYGRYLAEKGLRTAISRRRNSKA